MDFLPDGEQAQVVDSVARFLQEQLPVERLSGADANRAAVDPTLWRQIGELGWFGLGLAEENGGAGFSVVEETLLFTEAGRQLVSPTLLAGVLAARVAERAGDASLLADLTAGTATAALATGAAVAGNAVSGTFYLLDAEGADYALLLSGSGAALLPMAFCTASESRRCIDESVALSRVRCEGADALHVSTETENLFQRALLLTAAYLTGLAGEITDRSVAYAGEREQFGRPIGSFQAVKHRCAEMALRTEAATAMTTQAALRLRGGEADAGFDITAARILAADAAVTNSAESIQLHGAMGFTREMPVHLFHKRAQLMSALLTDNRALSKDIAHRKAPAL